MRFFFSYARADLVDPFLDRFYEDLCLDVSTKGGVPLDSVGFIDREQPSGGPWAGMLSEALAQCEVFVPVYSPHYFISEVSGKEWSAFAARVAAHEQATGVRTKSIVPVWWLPSRAELPPVAGGLHDPRDAFGADYKKYGLRTLVRRPKYKDQYLEFRDRYTDMILKAAETPPAPHQVPDLLALPNAFAMAERPAPAAGQIPAARAGGGARKVVFVVAVGRRDDMLNVEHAELDLYGEELVDWRPYHPAFSGSIVVRAQGVAFTRDMESQVLPADDSLFTLLEGPAERSCLVVLIVDSRAVELNAYQELFARLDRTRSRNSIVLVPSDLDELSKGPRGSDLYNRLYASLGNWMDAGGGAFRGDMPSMQDFERVLGQVLIEIQGRIMRMADVVRRVNETGPQFRPVLTGPGGLGR